MFLEKRLLSLDQMKWPCPFPSGENAKHAFLLFSWTKCPAVTTPILVILPKVIYSSLPLSEIGCATIDGETVLGPEGL